MDKWAGKAGALSLRADGGQNSWKSGGSLWAGNACNSWKDKWAGKVGGSLLIDGTWMEGKKAWAYE